MVVEQAGSRKKLKLWQIGVGLVVVVVAGIFGVDLTGERGDDGRQTPTAETTRSGTPEPRSRSDDRGQTTKPQASTNKAPTNQASTNQASGGRTAGSADATASAWGPVYDADEVRAAMQRQESKVMVLVTMPVVAVLPDDNEGSRHQRFLLGLRDKVGEHDSVLVAHNIDLAPRAPVERGDMITVYGQFEWNDRGGVIHWTHHDPKKWREGGWIEVDGERYE